MLEREQALGSGNMRFNRFFDNLILVSLQSRGILRTRNYNNMIISDILNGCFKNADLM